MQTALAARRPLGESGVHLPTLGFGGATIGNLHGPVSTAQAAQTLHAAWQEGLRYFDTAPLYGRGLGELRVGHALRDRPRDAFVLSTKVGWRVQPLSRPARHDGATGALPVALHIDYSRDGTFRSVEDSLLRLGIDGIDIAFVHDVDSYNHGDAYPTRLREVLEGALPALHELRRQGVLGAIGVGVNDCGVCLDILRAAEVDAFLLAGRYTLLDRSAATELLPKCLQRGVGVVLGAPFNTGALAGCVELHLQKELAHGALHDAIRTLDDPKATLDQISMAASRAKSRCGDVAHMIGREAVKLHGAIGFTDEYDLQLYTKRIWAWREEFGNEAQWTAVIGQAALDEPWGPWALITSHAGTA